jgi:hypothetical protein
MSDADTLDAEELREHATSSGCTPLESCRSRERVALRGVVRSVTLRPRGGVPALEAELFDGSGSVTLVFLGRRRIAGIDPGREIVVHGRLADQRGHPVIYDPAYELLPG